MREVPNSVRFPALELDVLARWRDDHTFERSLARRDGAPDFVFYDGPPFATGLPHYGHILTTFIKDVVPRYQTMRGFHVPRRWGWDCHGLPVELETQKALGLATPKAIVEYGVGAFNDACRAVVMRYASEWETIVHRLGRWVDFAGAYKTMDDDYIESVVWAFKALHDRGLVYEGDKVVAYCTRCQTALSNFEAGLDDAYRSREDVAVTVRFCLDDGTAVLAWTTTPWTLPANAAVAVHPDLDYARVGDVWLAVDALPRYPSLGVPTETRLGRELVGRRYRPVFDDFPGDYRIVAADWVTTDAGTGAVHLAPAFGEIDRATLGTSGVSCVRDDGTFDDRVRRFAGQHVFDATEAIVRALSDDGTLFARGLHRHDYPHCWRCDSPLIYRAVASWFVAVTKLKDRLVANNTKIDWVPSHVGHKRFADWLANARDWAVSRTRFWGAPVPVWRCEGCRATRVVGSRAELGTADWHRPAIDDVTFACACGGTMRRVPEVLDCWFESGAMPYAQVHYPFERAERFTGSFPGDFIVEYIAQTRGWFYTMHVLATALFDEPPFEHAVCHGVLLGDDGRKMSKRLRNYPDPMELVAEHGSDALRIALLTSGAVSGNDIRFSAASVRDAVRRFHLPLWNTLHLYTAYAAIDGFEPAGQPNEPSRLERALLSEVEALRAEVETAMTAYDFAGAYAAIEQFITTLSTWYVRLLKPALWRPGLDDAKRSTYETIHAALAQLARVGAPFMPFVCEAVHTALGGRDSVHLEDWPAPRPDRRDDALVDEMRRLRDVVRVARRVREQRGVKHRQPLRRAAIAGVTAQALDANRELLTGELNVKAVELLDDVANVVRREVVLDYAKLGKRLRGAVKTVAAAIRAGDYVERADGCVEVAGEVLEADELTRRAVVADPSLAAAADGEIVVVLDVTIDDALAREGL
ncbi:MAG TPA: isoleucine--tRNA ligase, partial [Kofleriaceae bacterium]|nr:isoleucine--tRNA ligase [Kofleriaceae bacterium]